MLHRNSDCLQSCDLVGDSTDVSNFYGENIGLKLSITLLQWTGQHHQ